MSKCYRTLWLSFLLISITALPWQLANAAEPTIADALKSLVKTVEKALYELDPFVTRTTQLNISQDLAAQAVQQKINQINQNRTQFALTQYVGNRAFNRRIKPNHTPNTLQEAEIQQLVAYLDKNSARQIIRPYTKEGAPEVSTSKIKDSYLLTRDVNDLLRSQVIYKDEKGKTLPNIFAKNADSQHPRELQTLLSNHTLKQTFNEYVNQKRLCPPFPPKEKNKNKSNQYPDCQLNPEKEYLIKQKLLQEILKNDNNSPYKTGGYFTGDKSYTLDALLQPKLYNTPAKTAAEYFLDNLNTYAALPQATPPDLPYVLTEEQRTKLAETVMRSVKQKSINPLNALKKQQDDYLAKVRGLLSAKNMAMNSLYRSYANRLPQAQLAKANLHDQNKLAIYTPTQLNAYIATHRKNAQFYQKMAAASPAVINKESLFVLVEIENQLFQNHQQNERVLAMLSLLALQGIHKDSNILTDDRKKLQRKIKHLTSDSKESRLAEKAEGSTENSESSAELSNELTGDLTNTNAS